MQYYDVTNTSLVKVPSSIVEAYIPLWVSDGTYVQNGSATIRGSVFLQDGGTASSGTGSPRNIFTFSSSWLPTQTFAFEGTIYATSTYTANMALYDITSSTTITNSQISTTATTATVIRSSQFTLTPGHVYGVEIWSSIGSGATNAASISDANLVVFG